MTASSELTRRIAQMLRGRRVVAALSGGVDSVTMLHLLVEAGADVRAAHVDHGLRPQSRDDAAFCANLAANLGLQFGLARIDVTRGNSTQGRARVQRYAALVRLAAELGGDVLAVAHHADDAWESSQLMLARGAGAIGAAGPERWSSWHGFDVARPLLDVRGDTVREVADQLGLSWREDPSNRDRAYARTRVRQDDPYDGDALARRRETAAHLFAEAARLHPTERRPTATRFARADLSGAEPTVRARVLLDAARELHGELPGPLVDELCDATADDTTAPRWFCGRRVAVEVSSDAVSLFATRGQGTRLLDERTTTELTLELGAMIRWFGHEVVVDEQLAGRTLRGPRVGDRIEGASISSVLSEWGVPPSDRWCWPCVFHGGRCERVMPPTETEILGTL